MSSQLRVFLFHVSTLFFSACTLVLTVKQKSKKGKRQTYLLLKS